MKMSFEFSDVTAAIVFAAEHQEAERSYRLVVVLVEQAAPVTARAGELGGVALGYRVTRGPKDYGTYSTQDGADAKAQQVAEKRRRSMVLVTPVRAARRAA